MNIIRIRVVADAGYVSIQVVVVSADAEAEIYKLLKKTFY